MVFRSLCFSSLILLLTGLTPTFAADGTWTNTGGGNWSDSTKWKDAAVADGADSTAAISAAIAANTYVVTADVSVALGSLIFSDTAGQNNSWTLSDGGNSETRLTLTNTTATVPLLVSSNAISYLDVTLAGSQGLVADIASGKSLYLRRANTYSGVTTLRRGELFLTVNAPAGAPGSLGSDTSALEIGDAFTAESDNLAIRPLGGVTLDRNIVVRNAGNLVTLGSDNSGTLNRNYTGAIQLNRDVLLGNTGNGNIHFYGIMSGSGGLKIGGPLGNHTFTVSLYNTNSFEGDTVLSKGNLTLFTNVTAGADGALGRSTNAVILADAETGSTTISLLLRPGVAFDRALRLTDQGSGTASIGCQGAGTVRFSGNIQMDRKLTISSGSTAHRTLITGGIAGGGDLQLNGSGELILEGPKTFTGDVIHGSGNGKLTFGESVVAGQPGPLGNSTNPVIIRNAEAPAHYLTATNTLSFARPIKIEPNVKATLQTTGTLNYPDFSGDIDYEGDLLLSASDNSEIIISGKLATQTNLLSISGVSSSGNYIRLLNPGNTLFGSVSIGHAARLVIGSSGAVNGATQILFAATTGVNPQGLFLGDGVTLAQPVHMPRTPYVGNSATLAEIGMRMGGEALFGGPVSLIRSNASYAFNFTAPASGLVRFTNTVSGLFLFRKTGLGAVALEGANSWTSETEIAAGTLWAVEGQGLPADAKLLFTGGVLESTGLFSRVIGPNQGQVMWRAPGHGGFSAMGGKLTVDLNNDGPVALTWGSYGFVSNNTQLRFGSALADHTVEFVDPLVLNAGVTIHAYDNPAVLTDKAVLSGELSGSQGFAKSGPGVLVLAATNTLAGNLAVNTDGGTLLVNGELPPNGSTLTIYSNGFIGGSGVIRTRTVTMRPGSGFDWADDPGTLTITNSFAFPTNGVFRFVSGTAGAAKVVCGNKLTLPETATVEMVPLSGFPPFSAVILSSANTVGSATNWTIANNRLDYELVMSGNDVILQRRAKGTVIMIQ